MQQTESRDICIFLLPGVILNVWALMIDVLYRYSMYFSPFIQQIITELLLGAKSCAKYFSSFNFYLEL